MDDSRKGLIRQIIEKRVAELERILSTIASDDESRTQQLSDEATRVDALANLSVDTTLLARARGELIMLQRQLERIEHDDFGLCQFCGTEISVNRIASVPATDLCIVCAQQQEKRK